MELADIIPDPKVDLRRLFCRGRVISVSGRSLTVDLNNGAAGVVISSLDSCNPKPDQWVLILVEGSTMLAIGALNGAYRQPTLIAVSDQTATVTGLLNGVSRAVTKVGSFTAVAGEEFPLVWSADGSGVWVLAKAGAAYTPPPAGGGGGGGGGGTPTSYTTNYSAGFSGYYNNQGSTFGGDLVLAGSSGTNIGFFRYSANRFNELQGRTILSGRVYLPRVSGLGNVTLAVYKGSIQGASAITPGGWATLPLARINELVAGSGATELRLSGGGVLKGVPAGTVQIVWR